MNRLAMATTSSHAVRCASLGCWPAMTFIFAAALSPSKAGRSASHMSMVSTSRSGLLDRSADRYASASWIDCDSALRGEALRKSIVVTSDSYDADVLGCTDSTVRYEVAESGRGCDWGGQGLFGLLLKCRH